MLRDEYQARANQRHVEKMLQIDKVNPVKMLGTKRKDTSEEQGLLKVFKNMTDQQMTWFQFEQKVKNFVTEVIEPMKDNNGKAEAIVNKNTGIIEELKSRVNYVETLMHKVGRQSQ